MDRRLGVFAETRSRSFVRRPSCLRRNGAHPVERRRHESEAAPAGNGRERRSTRRPERLPRAAARLRPERRPSRPARPLRGSGGKRERLPHARGGGRRAHEGRARGLALRLAFLGANPKVTVAGARRSPGRVNYLIGNNPARWQRNLPSYGEVVYRDLWPGIDLALRGRAGTEVRVPARSRRRPRADPAPLQRRRSGSRWSEPGALRIETSLGVLRDEPPRQLPARRRPAGRRREPLLARARGCLRFELGVTTAAPAVIDPVSSTPPTSAAGDRPGLRDRRRRRGQRLRDGTTSAGLPHDRGRLRHDATAAVTTTPS